MCTPNAPRAPGAVALAHSAVCAARTARIAAMISRAAAISSMGGRVAAHVACERGSHDALQVASGAADRSSACSISGFRWCSSVGSAASMSALRSTCEISNDYTGLLLLQACAQESCGNHDAHNEVFCTARMNRLMRIVLRQDVSQFAGPGVLRYVLLPAARMATLVMAASGSLFLKQVISSNAHGSIHTGSGECKTRLW